MKRSIGDFLNDIVKYSNRAEEVLGDASLEELEGNFAMSGSITLCFQVIGEAVKKIPKDTCAKYPEIQWSLWAKMRDMLIHQYWEVDLKIVYDSVKEDIPNLKRVVQEIISNLNPQD